jgi:hypothetical protein
MMNFIRGLKRHRALFLFGVSALALALSLWCDPDHGQATFQGFISTIQAVCAIALAHWARKALFDYPESDLRSNMRKAAEHPIGAAIVVFSIIFAFVAVLFVLSPRAHATELPAGALKYGLMLKEEQRKYWPDHPKPELLAALVEQESCISLKHPKCWNPGAQLKTAREEGAGMGQITKAYRADGSLRFDTLADMRSKYAPLADLSWQNIYKRPDLQLRAIVLLARESTRPFIRTAGEFGFGDAAYNGGVPGVQRERRACELSPGCNAREWFDNVEKHCLKSRQPIYGKRSACDINREHVRAVVLIRPGKYRLMMAGRFN